MSDFQAAQAYIISRLEHELSPNLYYHSVKHTLSDVLPAAEQIAHIEEIADEDLLLLRTAVLFHDIGYIEAYTRNEPIAARIATEMLPQFGYSESQIEQITSLIMVTQLPQQPRNLLECIMCDADLSALGRADFFISSFALRHELELFGQPSSLRDWLERQLAFLESHQYFTEAAHQLHDAQKQHNAEQIRALLYS